MGEVVHWPIIPRLNLVSGRRAEDSTAPAIHESSPRQHFGLRKPFGSDKVPTSIETEKRGA
jgi:hypothetical protein